MEEQVLGALKKCAVGFEACEVMEEFGVEDGELRLLKKKVTKRAVPPDIKAVKMLIDDESDYSSLSDEELEEEKQKLLIKLKEADID